MTSMADPAETPSDEHNDQAATHFGSRRRAAAIQALDALSARSAPAPQGTPAPAPAAAVASPDTAPVPAPSPDTALAAPAQPPAQPAAAPTDDEFAPMRKQEIHLRRQHAEELQRREEARLKELDGYKPKLARADELEALISGAKDDPIALLRAAGFTDEDFDPLGRLVYANSPAGQKDPRVRGAGQQLAQTKAQRELAAEQAKLRAEMEEFRQQQAEAQRRAEEQALIADYYQSVTGAIGDATPHARYLLSRDPRGAQAQLLEIANRLYLESGPADDLREAAAGPQVLKAYEASRLAAIKDALAELQALGIDPATLVEAAKPRPAPAAAPAPTAFSPSPSTLTPGGGAPTQLRPPGRRPRAELIADIEDMIARR